MPSHPPSSHSEQDLSKNGSEVETADTNLEAFQRRLKVSSFGVGYGSPSLTLPLSPIQQNDQKHKAARGLHPVRAGLSLAWSNLSVRGLGGKDEVIYSDDLGSVLSGPFTSIKDKKRAARLAAIRGEVENGIAQKDESLKKGERFLLHNLGGVVKAGEMMLVLVSSLRLLRAASNAEFRSIALGSPRSRVHHLPKIGRRPH